MTGPVIPSISLFSSFPMAATLSFYRDRLGFAATFHEPARDDFVAIVRRDGAMIMFKNVGVEPLSNCERQPAARWDAYLHA